MRSSWRQVFCGFEALWGFGHVAIGSEEHSSRLPGGQPRPLKGFQVRQRQDSFRGVPLVLGSAVACAVSTLCGDVDELLEFPLTLG